ncbi:MAG TPA: diaminopimelate epimerase [Caulobacteraceae bacterium]|nr:diaminopimelate epimerase [Caulobacteraceae bacterium]
MSRPFLKMNGLGNDFVVVEAREAPFRPDASQARAIADRASGIGCDQLIAIEPSARADAFMRIWNADGGEVDACGNATRCVAWRLMQELAKDEVLIETGAGFLRAARAGEDRISVDMGEPRLGWREIPLAREMDTVALDYDGSPGAVSMGNPHAVFFVDAVADVPISELGPKIEHDPLFPEAVNAGFAQVKSRDRIRLRVWERGAGLTRACGTGACAALVAAHRKGLTGRKAVLELDGGDLEIEWRADNHVVMTGPVALEFEGELP